MGPSLMMGSVTEQTRACPCDALMHDPTVSVEGNRFLFTGFQLCRAESSPVQSPALPRPSTSHASQKAMSQNHAQKFLISPSVHKPAVQTGLHPLWKVLLWVSELPSSHSHSLLQDLGYVVLSLHVVVQGHMCCVTLDHGTVQGGTHPKRPRRVASLYVLQRRSLHSWSQFSSAPSTSHESVLG